MIANLFVKMSTVFINKHFQRCERVMETSFCRVFNLVTKFAFFRTDTEKKTKKKTFYVLVNRRKPPFLEINNFLQLPRHGLCNSVFGVEF